MNDTLYQNLEKKRFLIFFLDVQKTFKGETFDVKIH